MWQDESEVFDQSVVSEDTTVETVIAEEAVIQTDTIVVEEPESADVVEDVVTEEPVVEEEIPETKEVLTIEEEIAEIEEPSVDDKFVVKINGNLWLQSFQPYLTAKLKYKAMVCDYRMALNYAGLTHIRRHVTCEVVKL